MSLADAGTVTDLLTEVCLEDVIPLTQYWLAQSPEALSYLRSRSVGASQVKDYGIGFSGPDGFCVEGSDLEIRPNLIVFPLQDTYGRLQGVLTRNLSPAGSEMAYNFSYFSDRAKAALFGLHSNLEFVYKHSTVILVEGILDALVIHPFVPAACAIMTSTLNKAQAEVLQRYVERIIFVPDNDSTGKRMAKSFVYDYGRDFKVNVLNIPEKDPSRWWEKDPTGFKDFWEDIRDTYFV